MNTETITCVSCGIQFCAPAHWVQQRRDDHVGFKCPNGHSLAFNGKSEHEKEVERLKKAIEVAERAELSAWEKHDAALDEFATCPVPGCFANRTNYHYSTQKGLFKHLAAKHGVFVQTEEMKELEAT